MKVGLAYYILLSLLILGSCVQSEIPTGGGELKKGDVEADFVISFSKEPSTYALNNTKEGELKEVTVLAFKVSGGSETFAQAASTNEFIMVGEDKQFTVKLKKTTDSHRFVLIANANSSIAQHINTLGVEKDVLLPKLIAENTGKWDTGINFKPLPMWGESSTTHPIEKSLSISVSMLRAVASVDIVSNLSITKFKLKEAYVYNRYTNGRIAPISANITNLIATAPSLPAIPNIITYPGALPTDRAPYNDACKYKELTTGLYKPTAYLQELVYQIYLHEAAAPATDNHLEATCLVIGGKFNGSQTTTYYRVDFLDNGAYEPILRNHKYAIIISDVLGEGYSTPDEAFEQNNKDQNMKVIIVSWSDSEMPPVQMGDYYLNIDKSIITLASTANIGKININTDYYDGWNYSTTIPATDLTISRSGNTLTLTPLNPGNINRRLIEITAGNLTKEIMINP
ncbi:MULTISPECIES: hypothetical protein [unclassified Parabacteroides]|uniref:hypothetical protein n=1 Tax=unclassified Parabacteroides TaxID=2649774 RepID=UPI002474E04F|nr:MULTISPECIES: hypothetical protein [unclassified Parabacteroides]